MFLITKHIFFLMLYVNPYYISPQLEVDMIELKHTYQQVTIQPKKRKKEKKKKSH